MSTMLRLILLFILAVMSCQSLGKMMAIDIAIYHYDGSQNAYYAQNQGSLTYDESLLIPASSKILSSKSLEENALEGHFFAFASDFMVTKGAGKGMNNPTVKSAAARGREAHKEFAERVKQKPGFKGSEPFFHFFQG